MAKSTKSEPQSQADVIRLAYEHNPKAGPSEALTWAKENHPTLISNEGSFKSGYSTHSNKNRGKRAGGKGGRDKPVKDTSDLVRTSDLIAVKKLADEVGGIEKLAACVKTLEKLAS
jgi:hypothetical protein